MMKQDQMDYYINKMEVALEKLREAKDMELEAIKIFNEIKMDNIHKKSLQDSLAAMQAKTPEPRHEMSRDRNKDMSKEEYCRLKSMEIDDGND
jgi:hypothetical protein